MIEVRWGKHEDIPWLKQELRKFSDFFGSEIPLYNEEHADAFLPAVIEKHVLLVAEETYKTSDPQPVTHEPDPVGFICGIINPHLLNPKIIQLVEVFWWVAEEHRHSSAGARLFNAYLENAKVLGVHWLNMSLEEQSPVKEASLIKRGFRRTERSYLLELTDGSGLDGSGGRSSCSRSGDGGDGRGAGPASAEESRGRAEASDQTAGRARS